jgi:Skp family chaperone for outer membrane proteins
MIRLLSRVLCAALLIPVMGISQTETSGSAAQTGKIVWLNVDTAILSCDECKNEFTEIQKFVDGKSSELNNMRKEFETLKNQLSAQGSKLTDEARADLEYDITAKETELQRFSQDTQKDINNRRDRITSFLIKKIQLVVDKYARARGLAAVQALNPQNRDLWVDPTLDITDDIIKAYNAEYPVVAAKKPLAP